MSLSEIERESKQLLSVGRVEAELVNVLFVLIESLVGGSQELFVGPKVMLGLLNLIDKSLELNGVSIGSFEVGLVAERDVFKTMHFTEAPEHVV